MTIKEDNRGNDARSGQLVMVAAGILGAIAASSCCILPLAFVTLGVSGAWIGNLTALTPYQPYILAVTVAVIGYGFYAVYWRPRRACTDKTCERPLPSRAVRAGFSSMMGSRLPTSTCYRSSIGCSNCRKVCRLSLTHRI